MKHCKICQQGGTLAEHLDHRRCEACGGEMPRTLATQARYCSPKCANRGSAFKRRMKK